MSVSEGQFVWYELMTTEPQAAVAFYQAVIGWDATDSGLPDHDYTLLGIGGVHVGGVMGMTTRARDGGARPAWIGYVGVGDVDATAARMQAAGGHLHRGPEDIPMVGRFAVVSDPQGALLTLFRGLGETPGAPSPFAPGHFGWHELVAADAASAFDFYASLFGWTRGETIAMGPAGPYQLFAVGGVAVGGMMNRIEVGMPPSWRYYINVADIDAAMGRATAHGGRLVHGPQQVPGGSWIALCADPQGGAFAMVAPGGADGS